MKPLGPILAGHDYRAQMGKSIKQFFLGRNRHKNRSLLDHRRGFGRDRSHLRRLEQNQGKANWNNLRLVLISFLTSLTFGQTKSNPVSPAPPKKILFIGNSYTGGIRKTVVDLIKSSPHAKTQLTFINPGGKTLAFHLSKKETVENIKSGKYDFVVLQDQSQTPAVFPDQFKKAALGLDKLIDASGAETVFYQTWGRRDGDPQNPKLFPTYDSMQKALSQSYASAAKASDATLAPVGDVWSALRKKEPVLGEALYARDGSHPSKTGAYLAACVFYVTFFQEDPAKLNYASGLPANESKLIHELSYSHAKKQKR